jgi:uncharacterized protein YndB with AHSA1/START domain
MSPIAAETMTRSIEVELEIDAPADAVWNALTDPRELARWFPLEARVKPGIGGSIWLCWEPGMEWEEEIRVWEPNRRLATARRRDAFSETLHAKAGVAVEGEATAVPIALDIHLETRGGKTVLRLVHSGFGSGGSWDEEYDGTRRGWGYELRSLRHYLERHRGEDRKLGWVRMGVNARPEEAWPLVMGARGLDRDGALSGAREGDAYASATALGDTLRGTVKFVNPPHDFAGTVADLDDALLRVQVAEYGREREVAIWLAAWGVSSERVASFEERCERLLRGLFPEARPLPHVSIRE